MNCPSRPDDTEGHPNWNQNPQALNADATTRADLNGIANLREQREHTTDPDIDKQDDTIINSSDCEPLEDVGKRRARLDISEAPSTSFNTSSSSVRPPLRSHGFIARAKSVLYKYVQFVGPGFLIAVAYIDPGNYATDVQAGAATQYRHLFIVLMSNLFAIFLQSLCIKLGSVTGLNLAENCRKHLPRLLTIMLYIFAEAAIIATDIAEVSFGPETDSYSD